MLDWLSNCLRVACWLHMFEMTWQKKVGKSYSEKLLTVNSSWNITKCCNWAKKHHFKSISFLTSADMLEKENLIKSQTQKCENNASFSHKRSALTLQRAFWPQLHQAKCLCCNSMLWLAWNEWHFRFWCLPEWLFPNCSKTRWESKIIISACNQHNKIGYWIDVVHWGDSYSV